MTIRIPRLALLLALVFASAASAGEAESKLLTCMRANIPPSLRIQTFELTSTDRAGSSRLLKGRLYAKRQGDKLRAMVKLTAPPDLNNAAYLIRENEKADEMYVFLPALNKVRRIKGGAGDGPLFGTDLSYVDVKQLHNAFEGNAPKLEGSEVIEGHKTSILSVAPAKDSGSRYSRIKAWVDEASCVALRVDFMEGNVARKRLSAPAAALAKAGSTWYAGEATMTDLKENTRTKLRIIGVKSGEEISDRYFDSRNFFLGG